MQKVAVRAHLNNTDYYLAPRQRVASLLSAMTEVSVNLHPVHGLFENRKQGYRAEFHYAPTTMKNEIDLQITCMLKAIHRFLSNDKHDYLFIEVASHIILNQTFSDKLNTLMQYNPELSGHLILLLQLEKLNFNSAHERAIQALSQQLFMRGVQLGIEIKSNQSACFPHQYIDLPASPHILITYSDLWMQQQSNIDVLNGIIRNFRSKTQPLWLDHHDHRTLS
ncbi:hypothetical protein JYT48_01385 [Mariprofundus ferrooxydans]|nr:hypothetical protein [Mariprofundus ferrooxydans]